MFATDWALKRFLKFVLKRNLGQLLKNEVDLEQLSVQLSSGSVELRQVLLNCEAINDKLVRHRGRLPPSWRSGATGH